MLRRLIFQKEKIKCHAIHRPLNQIILFPLKTARKTYFAENTLQDVSSGNICDKQEIFASLHFTFQHSSFHISLIKSCNLSPGNFKDPILHLLKRKRKKRKEA